MRVDGVLSEVEPIPRTLYAEVIARLKVLAGLRTDEHRRPQDGRFRYERKDDDAIDVRIAIAAAHFGEHVVLRLHYLSAGARTLAQLGMGETLRSKVARALTQSHGLILAAGPTGSGKTSTLYALLKLLTTDTRSTVTIEDPIEYTLPDVTQIQTSEQIGLTFESGLRSILRLDPDTIMVGEIRDRETARLAVNAALTGHIVLSSIHTNDAPTTIPRLLDLSVEAYLLPSTIRLIIAQRLVRRICAACRSVRPLDAGERALLDPWVAEARCEPLRHHAIGAGCAACGGTGYRGRIGVFELLPVTPDLRDLLLAHSSSAALRAQCVRSGMRTLLTDGIEKARAGITSLEEIVRLAHE